MAENNLGGIYTLIDLLKMVDPSNGRALFVAETLSRKNPIIKEVPIIEANQALSHIGGRDLSLPTVGKRAINDGAAFSTHKEVPITAPMTLFEVFSKVDEEAFRLQGANGEAWRQRKDTRFVEAMAQAVAEELFYGSIGDDPLGINGFATMFNSTTAYPNGDSGWFYNVQSLGGSSSVTSIYVVEWGEDKCHLIYPKGTVGGIEIKNLGLQLIDGVTSGTKLLALVSQFKWRMGLFVGDERCVQRLANIESTGSSNIFDEDYLIRALNQLPGGGDDPMTRIYINRTIKTQAEIRLKDKNNVYWTADKGLGGEQFLRFRGVPVQVCDAIKNGETAVS